MRKQLGSSLKPLSRHFGGKELVQTAHRCITSTRWIAIATTPSGTASQLDQLPLNPQASNLEGPDARFEVLGAPYSLLSVSLAASQSLYTRRGTLVGLSGKAENAISSLSTLEPLRRAVLGIPFFYQKISSASPITALISTKSQLTSFTVVHLDGTLDWMVTQRRALLAWTGQTISLTPKVNTKLGFAHWGYSQVTGRGLVALVGKGQVYQVSLKEGENYVAHPSNILAYTMSKYAPQPYRFKSSNLRLEVPGLRGLAQLMPDIKFFRNMRETATWKFFQNFFYTLRTWSRRTVFGDRLFLQFEGPATLLLQTRGSRMSDVLSTREVNEIADTPAGAVSSAIARDTQNGEKNSQSSQSSRELSYANVGVSAQVSSSPPKDGSKLA